jgi:hypothetical protein
MSYHPKSLVRGRSSRPRGSFRPRVEDLENRVTPSAAIVQSVTPIAPVLDPVGATSTAGPIRFLDTSSVKSTEIILPGKDFSIGWASGFTGATIKAQAKFTDGSGTTQLVEAGYALDPVSGDSDLFLGQVSTVDGSGFAWLLDFGVNVQGQGVDVSASGTIYTAGTAAGTGAVARIEPLDPVNPPTVDWAGQVPNTINLKGAKLDAAGTNLFVAGAAPGTHATDTLVIKLTGLANPTPTTVWSDIRSSGAGASRGGAVTVYTDLAGNEYADVANSTEFDPATVFSPGFVQINPDGSNKPGWGFTNNTADSDAKGAALNADGTWFVVGQFVSMDASGNTVKDIINIKAAPIIVGDPNLDFPWGGAFIWSYMDASGNHLDTDANSAAADSSGNLYIAGSIDNTNSGTGLDVLVAEFDGATGQNQIDGVSVDFNTGQKDIGYAITLDAAGNVYVAGTTNSDGLIFQLMPGM